METISIANRFFTHELNQYSNWKFAFWRELIQNAVDESCSKITIGFETLDDSFIVHFSDNGPGMSLDTLRNIYFSLGATGKETTDTIGGHGRARIVTCFAHDSYSIRTQNFFCKGSGSGFTIEDAPFTKGCSLSIQISVCLQTSLKSALFEYLTVCQLPCHVEIEGELHKNWLHKRQATRMLSFGSVHTCKSKPNTLIVRVRGAAMYTQWISCDTGVIVELEPSKSRDILLISRDQLKYDYREELTKFVSEIQVDSQSLKRDCLYNETKIYGNFRKKIDKNKLPEPVDTQVGTLATNTQPASFSYEPDINSLFPPEPKPDWRDSLEYTIHLEDVPRTVRTSAKKFEKEHIEGNRLKLLVAWIATCDFFIDIVSEIYSASIDYLPGFVFGSCAGMHKEKYQGSDYAHLLYINPLDEEGNIKLRCNDISTFYAIGLHECTHILCSQHTERWASHATEIMQKSFSRIPELKSRIQTAIQALK
jgi:hypothetical protein